jgi:hypothetical protein
MTKLFYFFKDAKILSRIECSNVFQRSSAITTGYLSDEKTKEITNLNEVVIQSSQENIVKIDNNSELIGLNPGISNLQTIFKNEFATAFAQITVNDDLASIIDIDEYTFQNGVFNDIKGTRKILILDILLNDGNKFFNALTYDWADYAKNNLM